MKKFVLALSAASVALAGVSSPAFADEPMAVVPNPAPADPDTYCQNTIPADQSGFVGTATNITEVAVGAPRFTGLQLLSQVGDGTPQYLKFSNFTMAHRHGQSPNIFALADGNVAYYPLGSIDTYLVEKQQDYAKKFDCHVHKDVGPPPNSNAPNPDQGGNDPIHPGFVAPPGLQTTGNIGGISRTDKTTFNDPRTNPTPFTDTTGSAPNQDVVICISPGTNPGKWRAVNDYKGTLGTCSTDLWNKATGTFDSTHSNSLPPQ